MKKSYVVVLLTLGLLAKACQEKRFEKPNVILILVDDQGYGDLACHGNGNIKTPNLDRLYQISARFTDYHVSPTCSPSRAALMTGHHNNRTGVWHTINGRSLLLEREITMAQAFLGNGYRTGIFGKWHLGDNYPFRPQDKGFEEVLVHGGGGLGQTMDHWDNDYFDDVYLHNGKPEQYKGYCTDIWFENAKQFIQENRDQPFFCYLPTNAAHSPYNVSDDYSQAYQGNENIPHPPFYGMLTNIDENIGKLIAFLKDNEMMENTILIFTTDNGTAQGAKIEGHRLDGFVVKGYNAGMRGIKASMYEGGHRVPLFIHWEQGGITRGQDIDALTAHYDIFPTLIDLCQLDFSPSTAFDGRSLVPLMKGNEAGFQDRIIVVNSQRTETPEPWRRTAVMQENWRLVNGTELYDLNSDPEQRNNIAELHPEKVETFKAAYDKWWAEIAPSYLDEPRVILGHPSANPVDLFCHDWHSSQNSPWHQRHIRTGYIDNGHWWLKIIESGTYSFKLRRWPAETQLALNGVAPVRPALAETSVQKSKASKVLNIQQARINIQGIEHAQEVDPSAEYVTFTFELTQGVADLKTWFTLEDGRELGAYYVQVERL